MFHQYYSNENDEDRICMSRRQLNRLLITGQTFSCADRDRRVLSDELYPPTNRTTCGNHLAMTQAIHRRDMYVPTQHQNDQYRLVAYLTNMEPSSVADSGGNVWKLFGNESTRHVHRFYIVPVNDNYKIKIAITDDIVASGRLRNIYDLPQSITFKSPLLKPSPYQLTELQREDFLF